jgi:hypothetical protein
MKVTFSSKGDWSKTMSWLKKSVSNSPRRVLNEIGEQGRASLSKATPKDTGGTAAGWMFEVKTRGHISELVWKNVGNPQSKVNVALLIEHGHGTRTGGYVPPQPYIKQAMESVWAIAGDKVAKEMIK